jgi:hypothetical protein
VTAFARRSQLEKVRMQVNNFLSSAGDFDKSVEYSMRQEAHRVMTAGRRIAQCMARYEWIEYLFVAVPCMVLHAESCKGCSCRLSCNGTSLCRLDSPGECLRCAGILAE